MKNNKGREAINQRLHEYTDEHALGCYVQIRDNGRIQMDYYFELDHLKGIMKILEDLDDD